jgi:hypothetical protein
MGSPIPLGYVQILYSIFREPKFQALDRFYQKFYPFFADFQYMAEARPKSGTPHFFLHPTISDLINKDVLAKYGAHL